MTTLAIHLAAPIADSLEAAADGYASDDSRHWHCKAAALAVRTMTSPQDEALAEKAYEAGRADARANGCQGAWFGGWSAGSRIAQC